MDKGRLLIFSLLLAGNVSLKAQSIILTSDQQLTDLAEDPDRKIDNTTGFTKSFQSLREIVEANKRNGNSHFVIAFDEFFRQYRDDKNTTRNLTPDMDEYVDKIARISDFAQKEGNLGLELSLLSPLELGQAYRHQTGHSGQWVTFKVGKRNPQDGKFSVNLWQQLQWNNNKGATSLSLKDIRAYAYREKMLNADLLYVNPKDIRPLKDVHFEVLESEGYTQQLRVYGEEKEYEGFNRVLIILESESQEMDYFADDALPFLQNLLKKYHEKGVNIKALYSDEMHIQQDWSYHGHHEDGHLNMRYFTPALQKTYEEKFHQPFDERYMLYFCSQPHTFNHGVDALQDQEYVMGMTPEDVQRTYLLRDRYYHLLQNQVVDLFCTAKKYGEELYGRELRTSAHSSWAQSPTIDAWKTTRNYQAFYEYTPNFLWSNTVHQAAAACYDYFKWGEYLQPTGNDFCEGGWLDRNYYGAAMAASIAVINKYPNAYAAAWGMPNEVLERRMAINYAFGCQPPHDIQMVTGNVIRDIEVLVLYPMDLVSVNQRYGSWMAQYGYANYLTSDQLMKLGKLTDDGLIRVCEKQYGTVVVPFHPLPEPGLLPLLAKFVQKGGKVLWCSAPPCLDKDGNDCTKDWEGIFGVHYEKGIAMGEEAVGHRIQFCGSMKDVPVQEISSDLFVDHIYPVEKRGDMETIATMDGQTVGTLRHYEGGGVACYCGFRLRDDQSQSLGYESRTLFEALNACNAYPSTGTFKGTNDNPTYVARTTDYFATKFPNGTTMLVNHYRTHKETWDGNFSRNAERDAEYIRQNPLPTDSMTLEDFCISGHRISYEGRLRMAFRVQDKAFDTFYGDRCTGIRIDGKQYTFSGQPIGHLVFAPVEGEKGHLRLRVSGLEGELCIPVGTAKKATVSCGKESLQSHIRKGMVCFTPSKEMMGKNIDIRLE